MKSPHASNLLFTTEDSEEEQRIIFEKKFWVLCFSSVSSVVKSRVLFLGLCSIAAALAASTGHAQAPAAAGKPVLYASVGEQLTRYEVNVAAATLAAKESIALPEAVQYVWTAPSKKFLYVAWSNGMAGTHAGVSAYRVDPATGALATHGQAIKLAHRPVHLTVDPSATRSTTPATAGARGRGSPLPCSRSRLPCHPSCRARRRSPASLRGSTSPSRRSG